MKEVIVLQKGWQHVEGLSFEEASQRIGLECFKFLSESNLSVNYIKQTWQKRKVWDRRNNFEVFMDSFRDWILKYQKANK